MAKDQYRRRAPEKSVLSRYFADIRSKRPLSREQEEVLLGAIDEGDSTAFDELVERNLSFVVKIANDYRGLGIPLEDLLNEGNLGLIEAARRFDPKKGVKFITYAIWWVRKTILQSIAEKSRVVRVPYGQQRRMEKIRQAERRLRGKLGREPSRKELARELDLREQDVDKAQQARTKPFSLAGPVREDGEARIEDFVRAEDRTQLEAIIDRETLRVMGHVFTGLTEQQRIVLVMRFGLGTEDPMTLQEAGERLGLSRERIRQIEKRALESMRTRITSPSKRLGRRCG